MPSWMASSLGMDQFRGFPFADVPSQMAAPAPTASANTPNRDLLMARALASGGYTDPRNESAIGRVEAMNIQNQARRQIYDENFRNEMLPNILRQQYMNGQRTRGEIKSRLPSLTDDYLDAMDQQRPFDPNGVRNGIAFRDGRPVGATGRIDVGTGAIPEAGFRDSEREDFRRQLMARLEDSLQPPPRPRATMVEGQMPVMELSSPETPFPTGRPSISDYIPTDNPVEAARATMTPERRSGMTINEISGDVANTAKGLEARNSLVKFEEKLPDLLAVLSAEAGIDVDEDALVEEILRAWTPGRKNEKDLKSMNQFALKQTAGLAERLGFDPKILLRWAQDRKKAKT